MSKAPAVRVSEETLALYFRRLTVTMQAGMPLHMCIQISSDHSDERFDQVLAQVVYKIESGHMLSRALADFPETFPRLAVQLVRSGETSGLLDRALHDLSRYLERSVDLKKKITAALTYPALILALTVVVVAVMVAFVFPRQQEVLESFNTEMPLLTRVVMGAMHLVCNQTTVSLGALLLLMLVVTWRDFGAPLYQHYLKATVDRSVLRLPVLGPLCAKIALSRILLGMSTMLETGIGAAQLGVAGKLAGNLELERRFEVFQEGLRSGLGLQEAARRSDVFPNLVCQVLAVAEEQGNLASLVRQMGKVYEEETDHLLQSAAALFEPAALLFMGAVVGLVVMATALPTINMVGQL